MDLHEEIRKVLLENNRPMSVEEITDEINLQALCTRHDGSAVCNFQVHSRSFNHPKLLERNGEWVKLK